MRDNNNASGDLAVQSNASALRDAARDDVIVTQVVQHLTAPGQVANLLNVPLIELARWAADPEKWKLLISLARLTELQAAVLVSRCRPRAASNLLEMSSGKEFTELARRASVDILNAGADVLAARDQTGGMVRPLQTNPFNVPVPNEKEILNALAELAANHEVRESAGLDQGVAGAESAHAPAANLTNPQSKSHVL